MSSSHDIQLALNRVYRVLASKRQAGHRDIRLGLDRMVRLVPDKQEWQGVHVGGTNGKGSICAFIAGLFKISGLKYGSYTSPAFPERHNGVLINDFYVNRRMYEMETEHVQAKWNRISNGWKLAHGEDPETLPPFELETATAFRVFNKMHVPYGIVEVGMGGETDATNIMKRKAVTVISKIGLDHQEYLGHTIEKIARVKAGIMRAGVPCIVDHTNPPSVIRVLREHARSVGTDLILTWKGEPFLTTLTNEKWKLESYQIQNLLCAALAFRQMFPQKEINLDKLLETDPFPPGRMEKVTVVTGDANQTPREILVDGAHNMLGIEALVGHVRKRVRKENEPVTWIMGMSSSKNKPFSQVIEKVVQPQDNLAYVEFAPGPSDPEPAPASYGADIGRGIVKNSEQVYNGEPDIESALQWALNKAGPEGPIVVTGSLYLVRDLLKLEGVRRKRETGTQRPGRAQLYRYTKLAEKRGLTEEEEKEWKAARVHWHMSPIRNKSRPSMGQDTDDAPPVSLEVLGMQRQAAYHRKQEQRYSKAITALQEDASRQPGKPTPDLASQLEGLRAQVAKHKKEWSNIRIKLKEDPTYPLLNQFKAKGPRRPGKPKSPPASPFIPTPEPEASTVSQEQADAEYEELSEAERSRRLRRQLTRERQNGNEEEDENEEEEDENEDGREDEWEDDLDGQSRGRTNRSRRDD